jgi:hypothetical protein
MPALQSATSASLKEPIGVEFKARLSQTSCARRSAKFCSRTNARAMSALHLEPPRTSEVLRQGQIVQQRSDCDDLTVVRDGRQLGDPRGEQPRTAWLKK